ncbi:MAG: hypothetical protein WBW73_14085 [Rhodoplanes sp.]
MKSDKLRWCPIFGQVEIDELVMNPTVLRKGDDRCEVPVEEWKRGTAAECNAFFAARFSPLAL